MPEDSNPAHDHSHHHHGAEGTHVMPDGAVMKGSQHSHSARAHLDQGQPAHGSAMTRPAPEGDQSQVEYTCPMHPQVRQMGPGHCPLAEWPWSRCLPLRSKATVPN